MRLSAVKPLTELLKIMSFTVNFIVARILSHRGFLGNLLAPARDDFGAQLASEGFGERVYRSLKERYLQRQGPLLMTQRFWAVALNLHIPWKWLGR